MYKERHVWRVYKCCMRPLFKYSLTLLIKLCQLEEALELLLGVFTPTKPPPDFRGMDDADARVELMAADIC